MTDTPPPPSGQPPVPPPPPPAPSGPQPPPPPPGAAQWYPVTAGDGRPWGDEPPRRLGMATAAMVCGIAGLVLCFLFVPSVIAVVLGFVAANRIRGSSGRLSGLGMATAGWITGIVGLLAGAALVVVAVIGALVDDEVGVFDLDVGDCVDRDFSSVTDEVELIGSVTVVDCDGPHTGYVFHTGELNPDGDLEYPADPELFELVDAECLPRLDAVDVDRYTDYLPIAPDRVAWDDGGGPFVCLAVDASRLDG